VAAVAYNRASDADEAVADALGAPVVAVPETDVVGETLPTGRPVRTLAPAATAAEQFELLAARVQSCRS